MKRAISFLLLAFAVAACQDSGPTAPVKGPQLGKGNECDEPPCKDEDSGGGKEKSFAFLFPANPEDAQLGVYRSQDGTHTATAGPTEVDCWGPVFSDETPWVPDEERYMLCAGGSPTFVLRVDDSAGTGVSAGALVFLYCADRSNEPTPAYTCASTPPGRRTDFHVESILGTPVEGYPGYFSLDLPGTWPRFGHELSIGAGLFYDADSKGGPELVRKWYNVLSGF
jgi:hypothetical protein